MFISEEHLKERVISFESTIGVKNVLDKPPQPPEQCWEAPEATVTTLVKREGVLVFDFYFYLLNYLSMRSAF